MGSHSKAGTIIAEIDENEAKIDIVDTVVDDIKLVTDALPDSGALTAIAADVAGLGGDAMRGTDGAALAANYTATRAGYIDELAAANLPTDVTAVKTDTAAILVDTANMQPKLGTPAADISADIAAAKVDTVAILTDTADMQPKLGTPAADISADIAAVKIETAAILTDTANMQPKLGTPAADISADIAAIDGQVDNLAGTEATGTHAHANNTNWQNVATITTGARHKIHAILMDFVNLTQSTNMRIQIEIDGATARTIWQDAWLVTDDDGVLIDLLRAINTDFTLDIQSQVAEGGVKNVSYNIIYEEME